MDRMIGMTLFLHHTQQLPACYERGNFNGFIWAEMRVDLKSISLKIN